MKNTDVLDHLAAYNAIEKLGKRYQMKYGRPLSYSQLAVLLQSNHSETPTVETLEEAGFREKCKKIEKDFAELYRTEGLQADDFIQAGHNIEIEKLLRYVRIPAHKHHFVELVFVFSGSCLHTIEGKQFRQGAGSLTIVNSYTSHELFAEPDCLCLTTKIRLETFNNLYIPNLPLLAIPISLNCGDDQFIRDQFLMIYQQQSMGLNYHDEIIFHLLQSILIYAMQNYLGTIQYLHSGTKQEGKMLNIMNYMFENYKTITLYELSDHFGYSEPYLCRLFREKANQTFSEIMRNFKLKQAKKLLETTDLKLNDICDSVGYSDVTQFIRDFKTLNGCTPGKYRKEFQ